MADKENDETETRQEIDPEAVADVSDNTEDKDDESLEDQTKPEETDLEKMRREKDALMAELEKLRAEKERDEAAFELEFARREVEHARQEAEQRRRFISSRQEVDGQQPDSLRMGRRSPPALFSTPEMPHLSRYSAAASAPLEDSMNQMLEMSRLQLQTQVDNMRLPPTDLIKFDGDPLKYWQFFRLFTTMVDKDTVTPEEKLTRLHQYTEGKAREAITHCLYNPLPARGYEEALKRLKDRFGNPHRVVQAWVDKVLSTETIKTTQQLRDFADQLRGCRDTLVAMNCMDELNGRRSLLELVRKLPGDLQKKWLNESYKISKNNRLPNLDDVVEFVETEAEKRSDPVFGDLLRGNPTGKEDSSKQPKKQPRKNFSTNVKTTGSPQTAKASPANKCAKCGEMHFLNQCQQFRALKVPEREKFVVENKLCKNCFLPGHQAINCSRSWVCNVPDCGKKHNRWLHPTAPTERRHIQSSSNSPTGDCQPTGSNASFQPTNVTCGYAGAENGKVCLPIVAVKIRGKSSCLNTTTYALLDQGANTSLISEGLVKKLKVKGKSEMMDLDTVGGSKERIPTYAVDVEIESLYNSNTYLLNSVRSLPQLNIGLGCLATEQERSRWSHLRDIPIPDIQASDVELVIGQDAPRLLRAEEYRVGGDNDPYATKTVLGWVINGPIDHRNGAGRTKAYFLKTDSNLQDQVEKFWRLDDPSTMNEAMSTNDRKVLHKWEESVQKEDGHYCLPIPFKSEEVQLPQSYGMAKRRLQSLQRKLSKEDHLRKGYIDAMKLTLEKGYAEEVPEVEMCRNDGKVWYVPHHAVVHPRKPDKVRVVYDCAAKCDGISLNDIVHQGPDLANKLIGVLLRFRQSPIALMADIESMFCQIRVTPCDRDVLRFLWFKNHEINNDIVTYRMKTHLFGGVWSPSCANFTLRKCALDNAHMFDETTVSTVERNFYVDDCLKSMESVPEAIHLTNELTNLLGNGSFRLTKWISNSREVLKSIPAEEHAKGVLSLDLEQNLPRERALGALWDSETDHFGFSINIDGKLQGQTKRNLLSIVSSVYDPLGFVGPFLISAKIMFQMACRLNLAWDEELPCDLSDQWARWLSDLPMLQDFQIPRCVKPKSPMRSPITMQLHHFCDASEKGFGAVTYLRLVDGEKHVHCTMVMSKNRLAPIKKVTTPRLELMAAVVAVKLEETLRLHLEFDLLESVFWTDSMIVLQYLNNHDKRFQTFVANRVSLINDHTLPSQWRHVESKENPADDLSRGLSAKELVTNERWVKGPGFLWEDESLWPARPELGRLPDDAEVKKPSKIYTTMTSEETTIEKFFAKYSSWYRLKRAVVLILRVKDILQKRCHTRLNAPITLSEMQRAEFAVVDYVQRLWLSSQMTMKNLKGLMPLRLEDGLLRIGGRLRNAPISNDAKHPAILPQGHHVTRLIIWHFHEKTGHSGTERVLAETRQSYWIVKGRIAVKQVLRKCIPCKIRNPSVGTQLMADLPADRVKPNEPPFSRVGVDYFGPITVKRARSEVKRYGCLFTCLATRAVHLEVAHSLDTSGFINAFHRFAARRGNPTCIRSDNGTNFVGAKREMKRALDEWNQLKISSDLLQEGT